MAISSLGVGSGLDISGIITKLMQVESQPLTVLNAKEASYQSRLSAYGSIKSALSAFQTALSGLTDASKFQALKASSSDSTFITATASSTASAGTYSVDVAKLAQSQRLVAAGQTSATAAIGTGASTTLTFDFGTISGGAFTSYDAVASTGGTYAGSTFTSNGNGIKTVTIGSNNNSLAGIRDAINAAKIGVTASIVNDGGTSPYRLVLSSDTAGKASSVKISVAGDATISSLLSNDPAGTQNLHETVTAQNTEANINGVFVSKASTSLSDVVQGVTLNLLKTGTSTVTVAQDSAGATTSINAFVKAYNELNATLKNLSSYDSSSKKGAILQGDATVRTIQNQIRNLLNKPLTGTGEFSSLAQVGITFQRDGTLAVNATKLQSALNANAADVASLFASTGKATDSLVSYSSSTSKTRAGVYDLSISQLATQGKLTASMASPLTVTAGVNDTLNITVDGVSATVTLTEKTYGSAAELALELQSKINGSSTLISAGNTVKVEESGGVLSITSNRYGSASNITLGGNAADSLFGAGRTSTAGLDAAGTFNGVEASGSGQSLTGNSGNGAEGLKVLVSGGATGSRGTVSYSQGFAFQLNALMDTLLGSSGPLTSATERLNNNIKDIDTRRETLTRRLTAIEARYRAQYTALDTLVANMNQTSSYLTQQLANLPGASS